MRDGQRRLQEHGRGRDLETAASTGLSSVVVNALAIDPTTPEHALRGHRCGRGRRRRQEHGRRRHLAVHGPAPAWPVPALAIDPTTPSTLYAGIHYGVFKSTDAGATWANVGLGGPLLRPYALAIDPNTPDTLYAGTGRRRVQEHGCGRHLERGQHRTER